MTRLPPRPRGPWVLALVSMLAAGLAFAEGSDSAPKWSKPRRLASAPMGMGISISQLIPRVGRGEVDLIYSVYPSRDYRLLEKRLHTLLPSGRWTGLADLPFSNPSARIQTKGLPESLLLGESPNGLLVLHSSGNGEWARLFQIEGDADELSSGTLRQKSDGSWRLYWREGAKRWTYGPPSGVGRDLPILTAPLKAGVIGEMSAISRHGEHLLLETERVWFVVKTETGAGEAKRVGLEVRRAWPPTATAIPPTSLWSYQGELASVYRPTGLRTLTVGDRSVVTWVVKEIGVGSLNLWAAWTNPAGEWESARRLGRISQEADAQLTSDRRGRVYFVWATAQQAGGWQFDSGVWSAIPLFDIAREASGFLLSSGAPEGFAALFLEPYGGMFENHNTKAVSVALYSPGGGWGSERQVVRSNYWEIRAPRVAVDALGGVVVVWVSDTWLGDRLWWSRLAPAEQP